MLLPGGLSVVGFGDGVGEAIGLARAVEVGEDLLRERDVFVRATNGDGALRGHIKQFCRGKHVAQIGLDFIGILQPGDVAEIERLIRRRFFVRGGKVS